MSEWEIQHGNLVAMTSFVFLITFWIWPGLVCQQYYCKCKSWPSEKNVQKLVNICVLFTDIILNASILNYQTSQKLNSRNISSFTVDNIFRKYCLQRQRSVCKNGVFFPSLRYFTIISLPFSLSFPLRGVTVF